MARRYSNLAAAGSFTATTSSHSPLTRGFRARIKTLFSRKPSSRGATRSNSPATKRRSLRGIFHRQKPSWDDPFVKRRSVRESLKLFLHMSNTKEESPPQDNSASEGDIIGHDHSPVIPVPIWPITNPRRRPRKTSIICDESETTSEAPSTPSPPPRTAIIALPDSTSHAATNSERNTSTGTNRTGDTTATSASPNPVLLNIPSKTPERSPDNGVAKNLANTLEKATAEAPTKCSGNSASAISGSSSALSIRETPVRQDGAAPRIPKPHALRRPSSLLAEYNAIMDSMFKMFMLDEGSDKGGIPKNKDSVRGNEGVFEALSEMKDIKTGIDQVCDLCGSATNIVKIAGGEIQDTIGTCSSGIGKGENSAGSECHSHVATMSLSLADPINLAEASSSSFYTEDGDFNKTLEDGDENRKIYLNDQYVARSKGLPSIPELNEDKISDNDQDTGTLTQQKARVQYLDCFGEPLYKDETDTTESFNENPLHGRIQAWWSTVKAIFNKPSPSASENGDDDYENAVEDSDDSDSDEEDTNTGQRYVVIPLRQCLPSNKPAWELWKTHSYVDFSGHMDLWSASRLKRDRFEPLPKCTWSKYTERSILDDRVGPDIMLTTPEGNQLWLDDCTYYGELLSDKSNGAQPMRVFRMSWMRWSFRLCRGVLVS